MMRILFLVFNQAAVGGLALLPLVPHEAGKAFFRIMGLVFLLLGIFGLGSAIVSGDMSSRTMVSIIAFIFLLGAYAFALFREIPRLGGVLYYLALLSGIISLVIAAFDYLPTQPPLPAVVYLLDFLASALLSGSVLMGMALGHWYLAAHKMPIEPLKRVVLVVIFSSLALGFLIALGFLLGGGGLLPKGESANSVRYIVVAGARIVFGILGPIFLGIVTWDVLRYRKTTSATGIMYVAMAATVAGQLSAGYLLTTTGVPW